MVLIGSQWTWPQVPGGRRWWGQRLGLEGAVGQSVSFWTCTGAVCMTGVRAAKNLLRLVGQVCDGTSRNHELEPGRKGPTFSSARDSGPGNIFCPSGQRLLGDHRSEHKVGLWSRAVPWERAGLACIQICISTAQRGSASPCIKQDYNSPTHGP